MDKKQNGYPADYLRRSRRRLLGYAQVLLIAGGIACFFAYRAIYQNGEIQFAGIAGAVFLFLLWVGYDIIVSRVRIALYFEEKVSGSSVWSEVLARNCTYLDTAAADAGLIPLSSFGFADDFQNETVVWHDPEQGLKTVLGLVQKLRSNPKIVDDANCAISDLTEIEGRLREACKSKTGFCFIFHYDSINGMEVEQRKGHF